MRFGLPFGLSLACALAGGACVDPETLGPAEGARPERPGKNEAILRSVEVHRFEEDRLRTRLWAHVLTVDRSSETLSFRTVRIEHQTRTGPVRIEAPNAGAHLGSDVVELSGGVVVEEQGRTLKTESARYDGQTKSLVAPSAVHVHGENFTARGPSMTVDLEHQTVAIPGTVDAVFTPRQ